MSYQVSLVDEVRRIDIERVIGAEVDLRRTGSRLFGCCPFHAENTASFSVSPKPGLYYCFGCHAGGDVIQYVMESRGLQFYDAVKALAHEHGIPIPEQQPRELRFAESMASKVRKLLTELVQYHHDALWKDRDAQAYLEDRGLVPEVVRTAFLGAPGRQEHVDEIIAKYPTEVVKRSGILSQAGNYLFRGRLVIPIIDERGFCVSFGGRDLSGKSRAKYVNGTESAVFQKSSTLYGEDAIGRGLQNQSGWDAVYLVEGYFDVLAMRTLGYMRTVAPMGTALTAQQAKRIAGWTDTVVIAFDGDRAGREAAVKAMKPLFTAGLSVAVADLQDGMDPGEIITLSVARRDESERAEDAIGAIDDSTDAIFWYLNSFFPWRNRPEIKAPQRAKMLRTCCELVALCKDEALRANYVTELADWWSVSIEDVRRIVESVRTARPEPMVPRTGRYEHFELVLAGLVLCDEKAWKHYVSQPDRSLITDGPLGGIFEEVLAALPLRVTAADLLGMKQNGLVDKKIVEAAVKIHEEEGERYEVASVWRWYRDDWRERKLSELQRGIERAEQEGDQEALSSLLVAHSRLAKVVQ